MCGDPHEESTKPLVKESCSEEDQYAAGVGSGVEPASLVAWPTTWLT